MLATFARPPRTLAKETKMLTRRTFTTLLASFLPVAWIASKTRGVEKPWYRATDADMAASAKRAALLAESGVEYGLGCPNTPLVTYVNTEGNPFPKAETSIGAISVRCTADGDGTNIRAESLGPDGVWRECRLR